MDIKRQDATPGLLLLMRLVPHDPARGLEKIETAVRDMNEEVETILELAFEEFDTGVTRGGTDSRTQHKPPSSHDGKLPS